MIVMILRPGDIAYGKDDCHPRLWNSDASGDWNDAWSIKLTSEHKMLVISVGHPYSLVLVDGFIGYVNSKMIERKY